MTGLSFITEENLIKHVEETIQKYGEKLEPYDVKKFNKNIIDPVKMLFDKNVYHTSWKEIIEHEIFRQRDKSNNNDIGYFHQNIFKYFDNSIVPEQGWDVIYTPNSKYELEDGSKVSKINVEMKNKHNTMNSASSKNTYLKMQDELLQDDDCACFLVEIIAKRSQNIKWSITLDKKKTQHNRIRRVSIDKFYDIVTEEENAFYKLCRELPRIIEKVIFESDKVQTPYDTVYDELISQMGKEESSITLAMFMLGFGEYEGFSKLEE